MFSDHHKLLHVAPQSTLVNIWRRMNNLEYVTADIVAPDVTVILDVQDIPFPDATFDVVFCNHVLEHVRDDRKAIAEIYRVLKTEGWAILQVPINNHNPYTVEDPSIIDPEERTRLFGQSDHVRLYGQDYKDRLIGAGFELNIDPYVRTLSPKLLAKYVLDETEDIYLCRKRGYSRIP